MSETTHPADRDWVVGWKSYTAAWGVPTLALVAAVFVPPAPRTLVWTVVLVWMGAACLANARRCGRVHCRLTGPFFLAMAGLVLLHGLGVMSLGSGGWWWLGLGLGAGTAVLWYGSERLWGRYLRPCDTEPG